MNRIGKRLGVVLWSAVGAVVQTICAITPSLGFGAEMSLPTARKTQISGRLWDGVGNTRPMTDGYVFALSPDGAKKEVLGYAKTESDPKSRAGYFDIYNLPASGEALLVGFHPDRPWSMAIKKVKLTGHYQDERGLVTQAPVAPDSSPGGDGASPLAILSIAGWVAQSKLVVDQERESRSMAEMLMSHVAGTQPSGTEDSINYASLSAGASAKADSVGQYRGDSHPASYAIDGDESTSWCNSWKMPAWLEVDFAKPQSVGRVSVTWGQGAHNQRFSILLSEDGRKWQTVVRERQSDTDGAPEPDFHANTRVRTETFSFRPVTARYMKVSITESSAPATHIFKAIVHEVGAYSR